MMSNAIDIVVFGFFYLVQSSVGIALHAASPSRPGNYDIVHLYSNETAGRIGHGKLGEAFDRVYKYFNDRFLPVMNCTQPPFWIIVSCVFSFDYTVSSSNTYNCSYCALIGLTSMRLTVVHEVREHV